MGIHYTIHLISMTLFLDTNRYLLYLVLAYHIKVPAILNSLVYRKITMVIAVVIVYSNNKSELSLH